MIQTLDQDDRDQQQCALEGCEVPIVRSSGGGRPRLYCCDAHRAEARRRRMSGTPAGGDSPVADALSLLSQAMGRLEHLEEAPAGLSARDESAIADARARATAEVLQAQQLAAEAARRAAAAEAQLAHERAVWEEAHAALTEQRDRDRQVAETLTAALDGARAELAAELLHHHEDVEALGARLEATVAAHAGERAAWEETLDSCRAERAAALAALEQAGSRALHAEAAASEAAAALTALDLQLARAQAAAEQAGLRAELASVQAERARADLAAERRHHAAVAGDLRRQLAAVRAGRRTARAAGTGRGARVAGVAVPGHRTATS
jgi:chromosome segregation ATPase